MNVTTKFLSGCNSLGSPFDILRGEKVQLLESENGQHAPQLFDRHYNLAQMHKKYRMRVETDFSCDQIFEFQKMFHEDVKIEA